MTEFLFIASHHGVVHRITPEQDCCPPMRIYTGVKLPVTLNQCLVYKLPHCSACWPSANLYQSHIGGNV